MDGATFLTDITHIVCRLWRYNRDYSTAAIKAEIARLQPPRSNRLALGLSAGTWTHESTK